MLKFYKLILPVCLVLCVVGCDLQRKDTAHPLFIKARKAEELEKYSEAVKLYQQFLKVRPDSAAAHKAMASIYDDRLDQPIWAIVHYQRYLECAPDAADAADMKKWLEAAKRKFYLKIKREYNDPEDVEALSMDKLQLGGKLEAQQKENKRLMTYVSGLKKHIGYLNDNMEKLKAGNVKFEVERDAALRSEQEMRKKLEAKDTELIKQQEAATRLRELNALFTEELGSKAEEIAKKFEHREDKETPEKTVASPEKTPTAEPVADKTEEKPSKPAEAPPADDKPKEVTASPPPEKPEKSTNNDGKRFYTVEKGDTLFEISRKMYGTVKYYKKLLQANSETIKSEKNLRPGQVLVIPPVSGMSD